MGEILPQKIVKLDKLDRKILLELIENCRQPISQIARRTHLSRATAEYRIRQLEMKEKTGNLGASEDQAFLSSLHPEIYGKCHDLFKNGAYAEAAEKGFKVVRDRLRKLTGYETGSEAFGKGKLHIKGASAANVDSDFNEAVKFLTMAIDRFRNEKSHTSDAKIDDPFRAYEYLRLSSLAMNLLNDAEIASQRNN